MKYILTLLLLSLVSCTEDGVYTIKIANGLKFKTSPLYNNLPDYVKGDTVIVKSSNNGKWHIIPYDFKPGSSYYKAVIQ